VRRRRSLADRGGVGQRLGRAHRRKSDVALGEITIQIPNGSASPMLAPARQPGKLGMRHVALACGAQPRSTAGPMRSPLDLLKAGLPIFGALAWDESKPARAFARLPSPTESD
jgi:hypothetical protein